ASLLVSNGPTVLAECLLQLAASIPERQPLAWLGATGPGFRSALGRRIENLMNLGERAWSPLSRTHAGVMKGMATSAFAFAAIVGTAWAAPQDNGDPMTTWKSTWKRSMATLALIAGVNADALVPPPVTPTKKTGQSAAAENRAPSGQTDTS